LYRRKMSVGRTGGKASHVGKVLVICAATALWDRPRGSRRGDRGSPGIGGRHARYPDTIAIAVSTCSTDRTAVAAARPTSPRVSLAGVTAPRIGGVGDLRCCPASSRRHQANPRNPEALRRTVIGHTADSLAETKCVPSLVLPAARGAEATRVGRNNVE
jgi:hypothetical protein